MAVQMYKLKYNETNNQESPAIFQKWDTLRYASIVRHKRRTNSLKLGVEFKKDIFSYIAFILSGLF